jgi:hypothetical protein
VQKVRPNGGPSTPPNQAVARAAGEAVSTTLDEYLRVARVNEKGGDYWVLVGAFGPSLGGTEGASVGAGLVESFDSPTGNEVASFELQSGWAYVVRPPRFPIVRTPRKRGGVRASVTTSTVQVLAYADGQYERIIFLGAFKADGTPDTACKLSVEMNSPGAPPPAPVEIEVGQYTEMRLDPVTLLWSGISVGAKPITDAGCPQSVRDLVKYVRLRAANRGMAWNNGLNVP